MKSLLSHTISPKKNIVILNKSIFFLVVAFTLFTCQKKEDSAARPFPRVRTISVEETPQGTLFTGEIYYTDNAAITDHGFVWSTSQDPVTGSASNYTRSVGLAKGKGTFSVMITNNLSKGAKYSLKAYAANSQYRVYGPEVIFTSITGSQPPVIEKIVPASAGLQDIITIHGKNFHTRLASNYLQFNEEGATILSVTDSTLEVVVPGTLNVVHPIEISLRSGEHRISKKEAFRIAPPIITGFSQAFAGMGDQIIIWGNNFHPTYGWNQLSLGDQRFILRESAKDRLVIQLLACTERKLIRPTVTVMDQTGESTIALELLPSVITDIQPRKMAPGDTITITGNYLAYPGATPTVDFGNRFSFLVSANANQIKAVVPFIEDRSSVDITVYFSGTSVQIPVPFQTELLIPSPVVDRFYPDHGKAGTEVTIEGDNFSANTFYNRVYFGSQEARVMQATKTTLSVWVPSGIIGPTTITVSKAGQTTEAGTFTVTQ